MNTPTLDEAQERFALKSHAHVFEPDHCANCFGPLPADVEGLFCDAWCQEITKVVRYWRGVLRDGRILRPDVLEALTTKKAFLLAGGYAARGRTLPLRIRAAVKRRDAGRCTQCSKPGTEIDHIDGDSPDWSVPIFVDSF